MSCSFMQKESGMGYQLLWWAHPENGRSSNWVFCKGIRLIVLLTAYKFYRPQNLINVPTLPAFKINNAFPLPASETNVTTECAIGNRSVHDKSDSKSSSDSHCSGPLSDKYDKVPLQAATATNTRSSQLRSQSLQAVSTRQSKRIAAGQRKRNRNSNK